MAGKTHVIVSEAGLIYILQRASFQFILVKDIKTVNLSYIPSKAKLRD